MVSVSPAHVAREDEDLGPRPERGAHGAPSSATATKKVRAPARASARATRAAPRP
jgi:hypothetical protein